MKSLFNHTYMIGLFLLQGSSSNGFCIYTQEEYNRFLARVAGCRETVEEEQVNFRRDISK